MARSNNKGGRRSNKNRIMNVRVADSAAGASGLHVDRQISSIKESESQTRIVCGDVFDLGIPTGTDTLGLWGFDQLLGTDDFTNMIQQFNLFRVSSIKFEIYDINPSTAGYNTWGVFHDNYESSAPAYTRSNIADLPDSRVISGGTGQTTLYWVARGSAEQQFQAAAAGGSPAQKFGGLRYYIGAGGVPIAKFTVVVHAVVDFRGRR